jgi:hypothetical protein
MWRLHPRGEANRRICVDAEGAILGPTCVLVRRTAHGFRSLGRDEASTIQKCLIDEDRDRNWLFAQCQRIAHALDKGELGRAAKPCSIPATLVSMADFTIATATSSDVLYRTPLSSIPTRFPATNRDRTPTPGQRPAHWRLQMRQSQNSAPIQRQRASPDAPTVRSLTKCKSQDCRRA